MLSFSLSSLLHPKYFAEFFQQNLKTAIELYSLPVRSEESSSIREVRFHLCVPFLGRNVDRHINLSTLIFVSSANCCQVTCELATTFLLRVGLFCWGFFLWNTVNTCSFLLSQSVTYTWSFQLVYRLCHGQEYFMGGDSCYVGRFAPLKTCSFSWGRGERLYVLYLSGLQTPK